MAYTSCGETTFVAAAITWARSVFPPTSCRTFGCWDLRRVPLPAAIMAIATRGTLLLVFAFGIRSNNTRVNAGAGAGQCRRGRLARAGPVRTSISNRVLSLWNCLRETRPGEDARAYTKCSLAGFDWIVSCAPLPSGPARFDRCHAGPPHPLQDNRLEPDSLPML